MASVYVLVSVRSVAETIYAGFRCNHGKYNDNKCALVQQSTRHRRLLRGGHRKVHSFVSISVLLLCALCFDFVPATSHFSVRWFLFIYSDIFCVSPLSRSRTFEFVFVYNDKIIKAKQSTGCWSHTHSLTHNEWCAAQKWHEGNVFRTAIIVPCSIQQWEMIYIYFVWF